MGAFGVLTLFIGLRFWILGAWPVLLAGVLECALLLLLFHLNARRGRATERIVLSETEMRITRTDPAGRRRETVLPSGWLSVSLDERNGRVPRLRLIRHGVSEEIGRVLGESAKRDLASRLADALHRARNPVFDNPQLSG